MHIRQYLKIGALGAGVLLVFGCSANSDNGSEPKPAAGVPEKARRVVRRAHGSGRWFPGTKRQLESMVEGYIEAAEVPAIKGRIVAAIAPHAGYVYSGKVAGHTFRAVRDHAAAGHKPEVVVVVGFTHGMSFRGVALMDGAALATPMGEIALDGASAKVLAGQSKRIFLDYRPHDRGLRGAEHSAENEVPFVQAALPGVPVVIALMGEHSADTLSDLVAALVVLAREKRILVVASTDLLHDPDYDRVTKTDKATLKLVAALDHEALAKAWSPSSQVCCGIGPVLAAMQFAEAQGAKAGTVLHYRNSGDDHPESRGSWVVGYGAVVFAVPGQGSSE
jgi:AmmeMemoRadiSam system protein B